MEKEKISSEEEVKLEEKVEKKKRTTTSKTVKKQKEAEAVKEVKETAAVEDVNQEKPVAKQRRRRLKVQAVAVEDTEANKVFSLEVSDENPIPSRKKM